MKSRRFKMFDRVVVLHFTKHVVGEVVDYYYDAYENGNVWVVHIPGQGRMEFADSQLAPLGSG